MDPTFNTGNKTDSLKQFGLATGDLGSEIQQALDSLTEVKADGKRGYSTISIQHEMGRLPKPIQEVPLATKLIMGSQSDQKNPILQNMYLSQSSLNFKLADENKKQQRQIETAPLPPTGKVKPMLPPRPLPSVPTTEPTENLSVSNRVPANKIVGPVGPGLTATNEFF